MSLSISPQFSAVTQPNQKPAKQSAPQFSGKGSDKLTEKMAEEVIEQQAKLGKRMLNSVGGKLKKLVKSENRTMGIRRYPKEGGVRAYARTIWWKSLAAGIGVPVVGTIITSAATLGFVNLTSMREVITGTAIASAWGTSTHLSRKAGRMEEAVLGLEAEKMAEKAAKQAKKDGVDIDDLEFKPDGSSQSTAAAAAEKASPQVIGFLKAHNLEVEDLSMMGIDPATATVEMLEKRF